MAPTALSEKASRYISQLDNARCNGQWQEVAELARKVEKHAPSRKCLVATARAEAKVAMAPVKRPGTAAPRPNTAKSERLDKSQDAIVLELQAAIGHEKSNEEDRFQAQTCLAWLYWNNADYSNARAALSYGSPSPTNGRRVSDWTTVCIVKAAFFRASSEEGLKNLKDVPNVYESCLHSLENLPAPTLGIAEFCFWWERFFSRCCGCFYGIFQEKVKSGRRAIDTKPCLQAFRAWASNWEHLAQTLNNDSETAKMKRDQRLLVWKSYYNLLSLTLQNGYAYPSPLKSETLSNSDSPLIDNKRKLLFIELVKVEAQYESMLSRQVSFPKASKTNGEVDEWINALMANWGITCGPDWSDDDLGKGGRAAASRRVLESLYRAATLTFHSTSVLRHLFTVHTTLAEFMLAEKALDSYLEIIIKGKARVKKSGVEEAELDSDEVMLQTIAVGIEMLCEFGRYKQMEKAVKLSNQLLIWLEEFAPATDNIASVNGALQNQKRLAAQVNAAAHKAVAISKASWAQVTYESKERARLQADAIKHLKIALRVNRMAEEDPAYLYPLALILAETRNIEGSVAVIKQALAAESRTFTEPVDQKSIAQELKIRATRSSPMIECWHLMSLLLSSRQDFETAEIASKTALEQIEQRDLTPSDLRKLSFFEKKQIIEAKMTQIALIEVTEGSHEAVNSFADLIGLYSKFFELPKPPQTATKSEKPPPTATGTIKSSRGSIFGRYRKSLRNSMVSLPPPPTASQEEPALPPIIAVTADGANNSRPVSQIPTRTPSNKLQKRRSRQSLRRSRGPSPARIDDSVPLPKGQDVLRDESNQGRPTSSGTTDASEVGVAVTHDFPTPTIQTAQAVSYLQAHAVRMDGSLESKPAKSSDLPDFELQPSVPRETPFHTPAPIFSSAEEQRYSIALLNHVWLFVSALYRRAGMLEDARQAIDEAFKQAKLAEAAVADPGPSSVKAFDEVGWGGVKSVEQIWADSYAEMGSLCVAEGDPYEAMIKYEGALSHFPDHAEATVALANILLDIHAKKIPLSRKKPTLVEDPSDNIDDESSLPVFSRSSIQGTVPKAQVNGTESAIVEEEEDTPSKLDHERDDSPQELDLLASRDRAYTLLSNLTKLGSGWDDSDAWFALANAYEASGQTNKAKEVLWWVVELEEKRPVRHWRVLGQGYKLQR